MEVNSLQGFAGDRQPKPTLLRPSSSPTCDSAAWRMRMTYLARLCTAAVFSRLRTWQAGERFSLVPSGSLGLPSSTFPLPRCSNVALPCDPWSSTYLYWELASTAARATPQGELRRVTPVTFRLPSLILWSSCRLRRSASRLHLAGHLLQRIFCRPPLPYPDRQSQPRGRPPAKPPPDLTSHTLRARRRLRLSRDELPISIALLRVVVRMTELLRAK